MRYLLFFLLIIPFAGLDAQITFRKYLHSTATNLPRNGCPVPGGGYILCSWGNSFIRLDSAGNVMWAKTIQSPVYIESVAVSSDSCFIFSGYTYSLTFPTMDEIAGGKLDGNGNLLWLSVVDSTNKTIKTVPVPTADGGMLVCTTENPTLTSGYFYTGIVRFSKTGQLLWHKTIHADPSTNYLFDAECADNAFVITARKDTTAWFYCCDSLGNIVWSKRNNCLPSFIYSPVEIVRTSAGLVTTMKLNNLFFFDSSGTALTERKYSVANGIVTLENLLATSDGGLLVGGRAIINGDSLMMLLKTDATGNVSWATTYDTTVRYIRNMTETADGYFIVREMTDLHDLMILKTDLQGHAFCGESNITISVTTVPGLTSATQPYVLANSWAQSIYHPAATVTPRTYTGWTSCFSTGVSEAAENSPSPIYPNPSSGIFYFENDAHSEIMLTLYSADGKLIWRKKSAENSVDLSHECGGIYFLEMDDGESISVQRLMLMH